MNLDLETTDDFRSLVLDNRILLDVRAPVEFEKGAFPLAVNIPLLDDEQRRLVGIKYKEKGNASAVELGKELMGNGLRDERTQAWKTFMQENPQAYLYCFRGGQRSAIAQTWLDEVGIKRPRIKGGYKAFRSYLMQESERISKSAVKLILGGRTGSGKTILLNTLDNSIDLEGLAHHRGSSFGRHVTPQPTQISFEDALAYKFIQHEAAGNKQLIVEHESHNIGRIYIPTEVFHNLREGKLIVLETPMSQRVDTIFDEYVSQALPEYEEVHKDEALRTWFEDAQSSLSRVQKRLGSELFIELNKLMDEAFEIHQKDADSSAHKVWIQVLLEKYYDPMYDYQLEKSKIDVIFKGNAQEVKDFIKGYE
ncbi:MAG TPA: tRNA 2-selenouridine(34) synthase MnmH [Sulfurimonas sp.]|nr:tRNA 2-selenouridine(34) synthase MnmH [Sulfurimonas sp.]